MFPCKHLDYRTEMYSQCELITCPDFPEIQYWYRHVTPYAEAPRNVQFCKLRGRINGIFQCHSKSGMSCYESGEENELR